MEKILVTGGFGFIGSRVVENLLDIGYMVTVLDRQRTRTTGWHNDVNVLVGDVRDRNLISEAVFHADGVIHLAAVLGTQETIKTPHPSAEVNVLGSLNVFDACMQYGRKCVYICVGNHWMNNTYSITKTAAERLALMYNKEMNTEIAVVRGLNVYGPGQKAWPVRKVVPNFVLPALRNDTIIIYGDGTQIMDMIYVDDMADVLIRALIMDHGAYATPIEAGMGRDTTVNELASIVVEVSGSKSKIEHVQMRPGETAGAVVKADTSTLAPLSYDVNQMVSLRAGLLKTVSWYRAHD